jgi:signal transduction histidine kinase
MSLSTFDDLGPPTVAAIMRDCTERKAMQEAQLASEAKDRFLANMSHEIRTPLNGVLGLAQVLERTALTSEQRDVLGGLRGSAVTLERVLTDILDTARMASGEMQIRLEPFDLERLFAEVVASQRPAARAKGSRVRVSAAPGRDLGRRGRRSHPPDPVQPAEQRRQVRRSRSDPDGR